MSRITREDAQQLLALLNLVASDYDKRLRDIRQRLERRLDLFPIPPAARMGFKLQEILEKRRPR